MSLDFVAECLENYHSGKPYAPAESTVISHEYELKGVKIYQSIGSYVKPLIDEVQDLRHIGAAYNYLAAEGDINDERGDFGAALAVANGKITRRPDLAEDHIDYIQGKYEAKYNESPQSLHVIRELFAIVCGQLVLSERGRQSISKKLIIQ